MKLKYKFMSEKLTRDKLENDESNLNTEEIDYENLLTRLRDIKSTIILLEKIILSSSLDKNHEKLIDLF